MGCYQDTEVGKLQSKFSGILKAGITYISLFQCRFWLRIKMGSILLCTENTKENLNCGHLVAMFINEVSYEQGKHAFQWTGFLYVWRSLPLSFFVSKPSYCYLFLSFFVSQPFGIPLSCFRMPFNVFKSFIRFQTLFICFYMLLLCFYMSVIRFHTLSNTFICLRTLT